MKKLPNKPSKLINLALNDLRKAQKDKKYKINMGFWRKFDYYDRRCLVCAAGAVISFSLKNQGDCVEPSDFDTDTRNKLLSIDLFRRGWVGQALQRMNKEPGKFFYREIPAYDKNPRLFFRKLRRLSRDLALKGL